MLVYILYISVKVNRVVYIYIYKVTSYILVACNYNRCVCGVKEEKYECGVKNATLERFFFWKTKFEKQGRLES